MILSVTELQFSQSCIIIRITVFNKISLICTVLYTEALKNQLNYQLLTWQIENSINPDNSNPR